MSSVGNSLRIPRFLSASNPRDLERAMLENNLKKSKEHNYFDIHPDGKSWFVWFYEEVEVRTEEILKGAKNG